MTHDMLLALAKEALKNAYAPYSRFTVGAALLCTDGTVYTGCNIENAAFSPTVCAERVAFFKAVSDGKRDFTAIAIVNGNGTPCSPCGVCRQVMAEFCAPDFTVVLENNGAPAAYPLAELLPHSFAL
ncbi:MAG: cytidine deaminase [Clostridia bacterium]|nr:cytidine deaminase [Clostridia bacterium]